VELDLDFNVDCPIRQGDLLGFWDWASQPPLGRFGVIITADCDIANGRPDQELVYLRIVSQSDYIDIFWSRSKLERARDRAFRDLLPHINRLRRTNDPNAQDLDRAEFESWIRSSDATAIAEAIGVDDKLEKKKLIRSLELTHKAVELATAPPGSSCLDRLIQLNNRTRNEALAQAINDLRSRRDEIFFLTAFTRTDDDCGYYVLLDQIGAVRRDQISNSMSEIKRGEKRRIDLAR